MERVTIADKQRVSYKALLEETIPELLANAGYTQNDRYEVSFEMYPIDMVNTIEEAGTIYTILKTICHIVDIQSGEEQTLVVDLLNIPVYQELGFKIGGNYMQVLDTYDKPAGWSFLRKVDYLEKEAYNCWEAKLLSANYNTIKFVAGKQAPYVELKKKVKGYSKSSVGKIPVSIFFRALSGYSNEDLLEMLGYDNPYNVLAFSDNRYMSINNSAGSKFNAVTRQDCITILFNTIYGNSEAQESTGKSNNEMLSSLNNFFFKRSYMDLGAGNRTRFEYIQSFRNRALNKILAEEVTLFDGVLEAGTILSADILQKIDNSPIDCIRVEHEGKVHSLHKFSTYTFRALGYYLAKDVTVNDLVLRKGHQLTNEDLAKLNATDLDVIHVMASASTKAKVITVKRNADGTSLTLEDLLTAYSIFANNVNGYDYASDIDELTDKIVVPIDKQTLAWTQRNLWEFINNLDAGLELISHDDNHIINAIKDFSRNIHKNGLLDSIRDIDNTATQLSDLNNIVAFTAKDFKVTNPSVGDRATDSIISVHGLQFGRLDPYDSPESGKIGLVHHRTVLAKDDENGFLLAPYIVVRDGEKTDEVVYLSATEEKDLYIAEWNETFHDEIGALKESVRVRYKGEIINIDTHKVTHMEYSPVQNLSVTTGSIPFLNFTAGKRLQMSDNQQKQAVPVAKNKRAAICTGIESLIGSGVYKASDILEAYYENKLANTDNYSQYKEQILKSDLQLLRIESDKQNQVRKLTFKVVEAVKLGITGLQSETQFEMPFGQHTFKDDAFSYRINAATNGIFKCDDVVAYNTSYDIQHYNIGGIMDYGGLPVTEDALQGSIALGRDYFVGFKTTGSSSIDDGLIIGSQIVCDDTTTSLMIYKEEAQLMDTKSMVQVFEAPRDKSNGEPIANFNFDGLPKVGVYLYPGDPVIYKKVVSKDYEKSTTAYRPVYLDRYTEGQVISAAIVKKPKGVVAEVYLARRSMTEEADKFTGRIGNKGVVAKILPEEEMPYDPETGKPLDIVLNPLGVPSRMNITQLLEVTAAAAAIKKNEIDIVSPFHPDSFSYVIEQAEKMDIKPKKLIDGRTGEPYENEINVGYQYMLKLVHMAKKNIHAVGLQHSVDAVTLQPKKGRKVNGGQAIGEMESWCLESVGAMKVLQELQSTLSDDRDARAVLETAVAADPYEIHITGESHNDAMFNTMTRLLGVNIVTTDSSTENDDVDSCYEIKPFTDKAIRSLSVVNATKDSLHSSRIFGNNNNNTNRMQNRERWGWIDLCTEIVHPIWLEKGELAKILLVRELASEIADVVKLNRITNDETIADSTNKLYVRSVDDIKWARSINAGQSTLLLNIAFEKVYVYCDVNENMSELRIIPAKLFNSGMSESVRKFFISGFEAISYIFRNYDMKEALIKWQFRISKRNTEQDQRNLSISEIKAIKSGMSIENARIQSFTDVLRDITANANDPSRVYRYSEEQRSLYEKINVYNWIKEFIDTGSKLTDYLISSYPVMPAIYRPLTQLRGVPEKNEFDLHYEAILNAAAIAKNNNNNSSRLAVYKAICNFTGIASYNTRKSSKQPVTVLSWFTGKSEKRNHGKIRTALQKKRIGRSGRCIIIPSQDPDMLPTQIGLPITMAVKMYEEQLIPHLRQFITNHKGAAYVKNHLYSDLLLAVANGDTVKFRELYSKHFQSLYEISIIKARQQFVKWIVEFIEGTDYVVKELKKPLRPQVILAGRQPSLHRYSIKSYHPKIVFTNAAQVNSLVCSGYNADFDGDQMWFAALLSEDAMDEGMALLSARADLINPKDGNIILTHSQDIVLGIYTMTMFKNNALQPDSTTVQFHYSNADLLYGDLVDGVIHPYDVISYTDGENHWVSTAGRILFNALLPSGLLKDKVFDNQYNYQVANVERFKQLRYDGLITGGKGADNKTSYNLSAICMDVYKECVGEYSNNSADIDKVLSIFQKIAAIGFRMSERYGISISIFDFKAISDRSRKTEFLQEANTKQKLIEKCYQDGLLSDADKASSIDTIYDKAFKEIENDIFKPDGALERNNNIFIMFDSGARGSKSQIMQSIGVIGKLQKTRNTNLELPVTGNYSEGISSFDFDMLSYSTRTGMASTQNETKNSGYASRRAIYAISGLEISTIDCGKDDWWYKVEWGNRIDALTKLKPSKQWFDNELLGHRVDVNDARTMQLFEGTLDDATITEGSFECLKGGFHRIQLEEHEIVISEEMLVGATPLDPSSCKYFKYFIKNNMLTRSVLPVLDKKHVKRVVTDFGEFTFRYKLSKLSRSLLTNREGRNMPGLRKYCGPQSVSLKTSMYIITDETLKWIEESGTEIVEARILLDCKAGQTDNGAPNRSLHSCCSRCYGLKYSTNTLPKVGENVGIEAAQAVGEPAAQLTLSLVNNGGAAGESVASGVDILHKLLNGNNIYTDKGKDVTLVANKSGYLHIEQLDSKARILLETENGDIYHAKDFLNSEGSVHTRINPKRFICKDKEWVDAGDSLTTGYALPKSITNVPEGDLKHLIRAKQISWLNNWFRTFDDNNIFVNARHFELFTRVQTSMMTVRYSDNPYYEVGKKYKVSDILTARGNVLGTLDVCNWKETILNSSGLFALLSSEDIASSLPVMAQHRYKSICNSVTGAVSIGENLVRRFKKVWTDRSNSTLLVSQDDEEAAEIATIEPTFIAEDSSTEALDLSSLEGVDLFNMLDSTSMDLFDDTDSIAKEDDEVFDVTDETLDIASVKEENQSFVEPENITPDNINTKEMDLFTEVKSTLSNKVKLAFMEELTYDVPEDLDVALTQNGIIKYNAVTDINGNVQFDNVIAGAYEVSILSDIYQLTDTLHINVNSTEDVDMLVELMRISDEPEIGDSKNEVTDDLSYSDEDYSEDFDEYEGYDEEEENYEKLRAEMHQRKAGKGLEMLSKF